MLARSLAWLTSQSDEIVLLVSLVLVTAGLWHFIGPGALLAPGTVGVWIALPARRGFIVRADDSASRRRAA